MCASMLEKVYITFLPYRIRLYRWIKYVQTKWITITSELSYLSVLVNNIITGVIVVLIETHVDLHIKVPLQLLHVLEVFKEVVKVAPDVRYLLLGHGVSNRTLIQVLHHLVELAERHKAMGGSRIETRQLGDVFRVLAQWLQQGNIFFFYHLFILHNLENRARPISTPYDGWHWWNSNLRTSTCLLPALLLCYRRHMFITWSVQ